MRCVFILLYLLFALNSFGGSESSDELYCSISNVVSMIHISDIDETEAVLSSLENQFEFAKLSFGWSLQGIKDVDSVRLKDNLHGDKAIDLERMKLLLNYKLQEMILTERLLQMKDLQAKINKVNPQLHTVVVDMDDFVEKLNKAHKVEFKYWTNYSVFKRESISIFDKTKIIQLRDYFLSLDLDYCPILRYKSVNYIYFKPLYLEPNYSLSRFDSVGGADIIVDDAFVIKIRSMSDVLCFGKAYRCSSDGVDLIRQINELLKIK